MNQNGVSNPASVDSLRSWLRCWLAEELEMQPTEVDPGEAFLSYGLDSVGAMSMVGDLEAKFSRRLGTTRLSMRWPSTWRGSSVSKPKRRVWPSARRLSQTPPAERSRAC
jgi:acyl carrier protein